MKIDIIVVYKNGSYSCHSFNYASVAEKFIQLRKRMFNIKEIYIG